MEQLSPPKYVSKQKWLKHEIEHVLNIAKQGDYHHLVKTLRQFSK